jgi:pyridoxamine 5'-phosphate oxidase-like protein
VTATLPQEAREAFERFITCELTTVAANQQPIVWPVTPYYSSGAATLDTSTGLGYPKKANDARRNPHVALLFSDPTGSGIETGIQVLVQGTAEVDDRDLDANRERYRRESAVKLPRGRAVMPPRFLDRIAAWYVNRIYIKVRPERVFWWPDGDIAKPPDCHGAHLEEVRSGHSEEPLETHEPPAGGAVAWDERVGQLGRRYETAALAWIAPDGFPLAARVPIAVDAAERRVSVGPGPAGLPIIEGRACLTAHGHDADFKWRENFQLRGDLTRTSDGWALVPRKLVGGLELPNRGIVGRYRGAMTRSLGFYRTARRELRKRKAQSGG